jgi:hypothetical protein
MKNYCSNYFEKIADLLNESGAFPNASVKRYHKDSPAPFNSFALIVADFTQNYMEHNRPAIVELNGQIGLAVAQKTWYWHYVEAHGLATFVDEARDWETEITIKVANQNEVGEEKYKGSYAELCGMRYIAY